MQGLDSYSAVVVPAAPLTWEVSSLLPGATQQTERVPVQFPGPIELLGIHPTITVAAALGGFPLRLPTLDDVSIALDLNNSKQLTNRLALSAPGGNSKYVTLSALGTTVRWLRQIAANASPDFGISFRWKPDVSLGAIHEDALISVAFIFRFLQDGAQ